MNDDAKEMLYKVGGMGDPNGRYPRLAQPEQEPVVWISNKDFEPIRQRIMVEAYDVADQMMRVRADKECPPSPVSISAFKPRKKKAE
jgi:hypothetical protein